MGLSSILSIAGSGLKVTQANLDVVARNIANADTPGYTKKTLGQENLTSGSQSFGARETAVTRAVDSFLQKQIRIETAALSDVEVRRDYLARLDQMFGQPGGVGALDTLYNEFTQSVQELAGSPDAFSARQGVVTSAQLFAQTLNQLSGEVQALRQLAEDSISQAVNDVNEALQQLQSLNQTLGIQSSRGVPPADLLDERDKFIDQISEFLEIRVVEANDGSVSLFTSSGNALLEGLPAQLTFDHHGDVTANALYSEDESESGVGTVKAIAANGYEIDLIRNGVLNSGRIGALIELRDDILVETQNQLDELAHGLAMTLSGKSVEGEAVTDGTQLGFDIDIGDLKPGNAISLNYTTTPPGTTQNISIVRVDDPSLLPLANDVTANPNDLVIGVDFSGGMASVATQLNAALDAAGVHGNGITVSNPSGDVLRFLDDTGVTDTTVINSVSALVSSGATQGDGAQIALFVDGGNSPTTYSGALEGDGQKLGFAGRISVNSAIVQNNELLVRHTADTPIGDDTRPLEILSRLTDSNFTFDPEAGIGQGANPFSGTVGSYLERVVSLQSGRADDAAREYSAHNVVVTALSEKLSSTVKVDINQELSSLIQLQNAYAANARILQAVDEMIKSLFAAV